MGLYICLVQSYLATIIDAHLLSRFSAIFWNLSGSSCIFRDSIFKEVLIVTYTVNIISMFDVTTHEESTRCVHVVDLR